MREKGKTEKPRGKVTKRGNYLDDINKLKPKVGPG